MLTIRRERHETFLQVDEDVDEHHFGIVFEGIVNEKLEDLDSVLQVKPILQLDSF